MKNTYNLFVIALVVLSIMLPVFNTYAEKGAPKIFGRSLRQLADEQGVFIGAAIEPHLLEDALYAKTLAEQYNFLTPENRMKWSFVHPGKDTYDFSGGDILVDFAGQHGMKVRGHALVWHNQNPGWLTEKEWSREELLTILEDHIRQVAGHYKGKIYAWDVVNEAFDGSFMRETIWQKGIGAEYIEKSFIWAHEADPDAKLFLNDYSVEEINAKSNAMYKMVKELLEKGVPIHGVGFQFHLEAANLPDFASVYANVKRFAELGLLVDFTEIDIRIQGDITDDKLFGQAEAYRKLLEIMLVFPESRVYTMWGLTDAHSWVPGFFKGFGSALIFDEEYQAKPAFYLLQEALQKGPIELNYTFNEDAGSDRHIIPPFQAMPAGSIPSIDGLLVDGEWDTGVWYPFAYNQLNANDQRPPQNIKNTYGDWKILYDKNILYGVIHRSDDTTVTGHENDWENDNVEIFFETEGVFAQLRTIVGKDWQPHSLPGARQAVWSEDGSVLEFSVELPENDLTGLVLGWNIALADNDKGVDGMRDVQLYPVYGFNDSWEGKNLAEIKFVGDTPRPTGKRHIVPPFKATKAISLPVIDGEVKSGEWENGVVYQFAYNQLNPADQRVPMDRSDLSGDWTIMYDKNVLYGLIHRTDDTTVTGHENEWENDTVEVFFDVDGVFAQLRTIAGKDWQKHSMQGERKAVWNADGTVLEFSIELPVEDATGKTIGWNIALADNDTGTEGVREHQLYPVSGFNDSWEGKNLAEITFAE